MEYKSFRPQVDSPQVVSPPSRFAPSRFAPKTTEGKLSNIIYFPYRFDSTWGRNDRIPCNVYNDL